jgi:hypothetical protein
MVPFSGFLFVLPLETVGEILDFINLSPMSSDAVDAKQKLCAVPRRPHALHILCLRTIFTVRAAGTGKASCM